MKLFKEALRWKQSKRLSSNASSLMILKGFLILQRKILVISPIWQVKLHQTVKKSPTLMLWTGKISVLSLNTLTLILKRKKLIYSTTACGWQPNLRYAWIMKVIDLNCCMLFSNHALSTRLWKMWPTKKTMIAIN